MSPAMGTCTIVLKLATSLDGRIALANGESRWITGPESRAEVHRLRAACDVILTGAGTVRVDDPQLSARGVDGFDGQQPDCAVLDSRLTLPARARLFAQDRKTMVYITDKKDRNREIELRQAGAVLVSVGGDEAGRPALPAVLGDLQARGYRHILIEAGAGIAASALRSGDVTRIEWFRAPVVLGGDARPVFAGLGLESLDQAPRFIRTGLAERGADIHESYEREA